MNNQQTILLIIAAISATLSGLLIHYLLTLSPASAADIRRGAAGQADTLVRQSSGSLASRIQANMRAVSLSFKDEGGVESLLSVNDRVDVVVTRSGAGKRTESETVLKGARVLIGSQAPDAALGSRPAKNRLVTLEMTPVEAEALASARSAGKLSIVLAGANETDSANKSYVGAGRPAPIKVIRFGVSSPGSH